MYKDVSNKTYTSDRVASRELTFLVQSFQSLKGGGGCATCCNQTKNTREELYRIDIGMTVALMQYNMENLRKDGESAAATKKGIPRLIFFVLSSLFLYALHNTH